MKVFTFGDSWSFGAELKEGEKPFVNFVADALGATAVNYGHCSDSLGNILHHLSKHSNEITKDDIVLLVTPPDGRWYNERDGRIHSLSIHATPREYRKFLKGKSRIWFEYHHLLFTFAAQCLLKEKQCKFVMAHNFGELPKPKEYYFPIDYNYFLSDKSLTALLTNKGVTEEWSYSMKESMPNPKEFTGKYFEGTFTHPNELGHKKIAEMFLEKLEGMYGRR